MNFESGSQQFYGTVFRAAWRYNSGNNFGLKRPSNLLGVNIKYAACYEVGNAHVGGGTFFGINNNIRIYSNSTGFGRALRSDEIFSATIHESVHVSHKSISGNNFQAVNNKIVESWATAIELLITQDEYKNVRGLQYYASPSHEYSSSLNFSPIAFSHQAWRKGSGEEDYTNLFIDLVDNFNQNGSQSYYNFEYNISFWTYFGHVDNVTGFTYQNLENLILPSSYGFSSLASSLKSNKPSSISDSQIDELLYECF
jgi:hypothetical protein